MADRGKTMLPELDWPAFQPGEVWLVGAGPGDPGLLTLHALEALRAADVVVYDALVGEGILKLVGPGTLLDYAGKRGGKPSCSQGEITERLIRHARKGRRVVRLKGGDPFVFGRGGEEALALSRAGIAFRVVPGVTAGIGGLAYAGVPVTTRDTNHAVTLLTGHGAGGDLPADLDWGAIARGAPVLVMYMAVRTLGRIAARLIAEGRAPSEPVAVVSRATADDQEVLVSTLGTVAADLADSALGAPAIIVIGEVVRLREELDWLPRLAEIAAAADEAEAADWMRLTLIAGS